VQMPIPPADISNFDVRDDKVFYLTGPSQMIEGPLPGEKPVLHVYDLKDRKDAKVVEDLSAYALSADGKKVSVRFDVGLRTRRPCRHYPCGQPESAP